VATCGACAAGGEAADRRISWFEHTFSHEWMDRRPRAAERDAAHSSGVEVENSARIVATGNYA